MHSLANGETKILRSKSVSARKQKQKQTTFLQFYFDLSEFSLILLTTILQSNLLSVCAGEKYNAWNKIY